jgi:cytoskeletal protein CcmA (bactofilin family)
MLQSSDNNQRYSPNTYPPAKTVSTPVEQATIGRSLVIKGEVKGDESIYIDGQIEGTINFTDHRVTIGRNGKVNANIIAREVVVMGSVEGNLQCSDRVDIRAEGRLTGDITTQRISVEDGAVLKGSVQIRTEAKTSDSKNAGENKAAENKKDQHHQAQLPVATDSSKATMTSESLATAAGK